ncbi:MAG: outer membrane protein assembly factor [Proteobacteria bacterium]|nr:outer membrane protein assembly factor [Pseudomonadota bacterium]HQR03180.1 autotransporter assembly complex family protein [Rhodocyclaceae bacterium]
MPLRLLPFLLLCCLAAMQARANDAVRYHINLEIPAAQRALLDPALDLYRWHDSPLVDATQLRALVRQAPAQIREFLATEGFYAPRIDASLHQKGDEWEVQLKVVPGDPVHVGQVDLDAQGAFSTGPDAQTRLAAWRTAWPIKPGAVFRHADWEAAKRDALRILLIGRYPAASIASSEATVDPEQGTVRLHVLIDSGPAFTFGPLEIHGLQRYPESVVRDINPIRPGDPYDQAKLLDLQSRLQNTPYFSSVHVSTATDTARPDGEPVKVDLVEYPARQIGLGLGISSDSGPRAQVNYRDINILDRAWRLSNTLALDRTRQTLGGDIQLPLGTEAYRDSVSAQYERTDIEDEITRKVTLGAKRSFVRGKSEIVYGLKFVRERQNVTGSPEQGSKALVPSWTWTWRGVDSLINPRSGFLLNLQLEGATRALVSDRSYLRSLLRGAWYLPLGAQDQLILRGDIGRVLAGTNDGVPTDALFRTGGDQSVRGYRYQSLGIREGNAIVGGRALAVVSIEGVHWIDEHWGIATFIDAGDAADRFSEMHLARGYGAGLRWRSPVGPLYLDLAHGQRSGETRLHFSVGFNF